MTTAPCIECEVAAGRHDPTGGLVLATERFVAHALLGPSPLPGWMVLAPRRHARWWWELDETESAEIGGFARRIFLAQREALGAVHGYAIALGDQLHHMHLHLVPRFADTPPALKGRAAFEAGPEHHRSEVEIRTAAEAVARALAAG